jgi:NADPH-dependent 2,4-dienoyl-CoA reductase/sulfur reductase-like enzyme
MAIGVKPNSTLAREAGLMVGAIGGIVVDKHLRTSDPDIYAAGDNARFPYRVLGPPVRLEHWDNALNQGRQAGRNMAGAYEAYSYMPYFFSDLFEFGYEAVGEINPKLEIFTDWQKENEKGVLYYLKDGKVQGAMMCNVWDKVPEARDLIRQERAPPALKRQGALA